MYKTTFPLTRWGIIPYDYYIHDYTHSIVADGGRIYNISSKYETNRNMQLCNEMFGEILPSAGLVQNKMS